MRVAEVCGLDVGDILTDQDGETVLFVRHGNGRKDHTVPVQADVARHVRTYLAMTKRRPGGDGPLFRAYVKRPTSWYMADSVPGQWMTW